MCKLPPITLKITFLKRKKSLFEKPTSYVAYRNCKIVQSFCNTYFRTECGLIEANNILQLQSHAEHAQTKKRISICQPQWVSAIIYYSPCAHDDTAHNNECTMLRFCKIDLCTGNITVLINTFVQKYRQPEFITTYQYLFGVGAC